MMSQTQISNTPIIGPRADRMDFVSRTQERGRRNDNPTFAGQEQTSKDDTTAGASQKLTTSRNIQAGFVQKLFNMVEDESNNNVIWWSRTGDTFLVNPNQEFQTVLANFFKHTNPQSFVRQLNMYGFHKVNDVFQGSAAEAHLWEFKHGEGNFRKGDRENIREVKRRPSKHTLDRRETTRASVSSVSVPMPVPYHPLPMHTGSITSVTDPVEDRLSRLEHRFYEQHAALMQSETLRSQMSTKLDVLSDCVAKSQKMTRNMSDLMIAFMPDQHHPLYRNIAAMSSEIEEQMEQLRNFDAFQQVPVDRRQSTASSNWDSSGGAMSPFGMQDDSRRASLAYPMTARAHPSRSAATSPRRVGSISQTTTASHISGGRPSSTHPPPPVPSFWGHSNQQPVMGEASSPPYIPRRHTSADIRDNPGWRSTQGSSEHLPLPNNNAGGQYSPFGSINNPGQWPPSPSRGSQNEEQIRDTLHRYQIDSRNPSTASDATVTPQMSYPHHPSGMQQDMSQASAGLLQPAQAGQFGNIHEGSLFNQQSSARSLLNKDIWSNSGSSTRRSSMAHILNPADTAERDEEEDIGPEERPKRKRMG